MQDLNDKVTNDSLTAAEWNQLPSEVQNVIEAIGQTLAGGNLNQLGIAIASYVAAGSFYVETGAADAYVVDPIGSKQGLFALSAGLDGALVRFRPGNANTGSSTINVNSLGVKDLTREDGGVLVVGDLVTARDAIVRYDQSADEWRLLSGSLGAPAIEGTHLIDAGVTSTGSGTQHDVTGIPSWVKRIFVNFDEVTVDNSDNLLVQIGDAGGIESSGYSSSSRVSGVTQVASSSGFITLRNASGSQESGHMILTRIDTDTWVSSHVLDDGGGGNLVTHGAGRKALSAGPLTQLRLIVDGAGSFNGGQFSVHYE